MKIGMDLVDVRIFSKANSVSVALYGSASGMPDIGQKTSLTSELFPLPWVPQMKSVGNEPTRSMKRGFVGAAKNHPRTGMITWGTFTRGRNSKTFCATALK